MYMCACTEGEAFTCVCVCVLHWPAVKTVKLYRSELFTRLMCVRVPSTHCSIAKCYCSSQRLHSLYPYYQLLSHFPCLALYLIFVFVSPSSVCFHMSSSFTTYCFPFLILCFSWEALESGKGLNIRVNGVILHFDTPHIISPSISLLGEECVTFFLPVSPLLTLSPYLPVIMCCRWRRHC